MAVYLEIIILLHPELLGEVPGQAWASAVSHRKRYLSQFVLVLKKLKQCRLFFRNKLPAYPQSDSLRICGILQQIFDCIDAVWISVGGNGYKDSFLLVSGQFIPPQHVSQFNHLTQWPAMVQESFLFFRLRAQIALAFSNLYIQPVN